MIVLLWVSVLLLPLCWGIPLRTQWPSSGLSQGEGVRDVQDVGPRQEVLRVDHGGEVEILSTIPERQLAKPSHGAFLTATTTTRISTTTQDTTTTEDTHYMRTLHQAQVPTTLIDRYAHQLVALGLFLLVPVTLGVVELAERIGHYYCEEEYPDRGRESQRWLGRERRLRREMRDVREKQVHEERRWWRRTS